MNTPADVKIYIDVCVTVLVVTFAIIGYCFVCDAICDLIAAWRKRK